MGMLKHLPAWWWWGFKLLGGGGDVEAFACMVVVVGFDAISGDGGGDVEAFACMVVGWGLIRLVGVVVVMLKHLPAWCYIIINIYLIIKLPDIYIPL